MSSGSSEIGQGGEGIPSTGGATPSIDMREYEAMRSFSESRWPSWEDWAVLGAITGKFDGLEASLVDFAAICAGKCLFLYFMSTVSSICQVSSVLARLQEDMDCRRIWIRPYTEGFAI